MLWEISGKDITKPSYLYGTLHIVCENDTFTKAKVQQVLDKSKLLYLEMDMDDPTAMKSLMSLVAKGKKIKEIEDRKTLNKLLELASNKLEIKQAILKNSPLFNLMPMTAMKSMPACEKYHLRLNKV